MKYPAQYLKHGKALCGRVFGAFVDTFNWHNDFLLNLCGDRDVNGKEGRLTLDRTDPHHPVMRFVEFEQPDKNEGRVSGCFELVEGMIVNCFYNCGGITKSMEERDVSSMLESTVKSVICLELGRNSGDIVLIPFSELETRQGNLGKYTFPLYLVKDGKVVCDLRFAPQIQVFEI